MTDNVLKLQAFKLKGRLYTLTVLQVLDTDIHSFAIYLQEVIAKAPRLFENAPIVLDFSEVSQEAVVLDQYCSILRERGIIPVAVQSVDSRIQMQAIALRMAVFNTSIGKEKFDAVPVETTSSHAVPAEEDTVLAPPQEVSLRSQSKLVTMPILHYNFQV